MTNLPQGWEVKKLGEIGEIVTGSTPSKSNLDFYGKDYPFFKPSDFEQGYFLENAGDNLSKLGFDKARQLPPKTILVVCIGSLGKVALTRVIGSCNQQINAIIPHKNIIAEYIYYYCISSKFQSILFSKAPQTTLAILNKTEFSKLEIIYPKDIKEQERIVGILDESIKILEQNLLNLDELMQSALQKAFNPLKDNAKENYKLPQGWEWKSLGEIGEIITGTTPSKNNPNFYGNEYPLFKPSDLNGDMIIKYASDNLSKLGFDNARNLPKDTILVVCIGASIGKVGLSGVNGSCNQQINAIIPNSAFTSKYLFFVCLSNYFQEILKNNASQTTLPIINKTEFSKLQIPLPPIKEQEQITSHLDELSSHVKNLKQNYQAQIKDLQELKNSLLDKAFKGNL
ncbi:restriction endonuclease subunit S [Campylobacter jejuni]|uniref:Restriction endonuclease subunit S n=1 Tax=Campylobacter jejuni TaxID=197 RepID=A0A5Y6S1Y1_CAMJU|nr:restriction endonuclease subunit S [Campylobacter jejuni]AZN11598.1 restriction endonuclease subunit S [Campylobacter jejuni subsp. jejuni]EAH6812743.1 restriction endonuclease subunit S [Campylobacter jejuni]EAH9322243.1 restriction endonuclease subunit S [Campylobacter jejuni]EAI3202138.1 restriction endonuclease subunit S [Campylobacter jejuni]EAI4900136.1 restriction endonuclease subunit S [Campylobacter jejuni]